MAKKKTRGPHKVRGDIEERIYRTKVVLPRLDGGGGSQPGQGLWSRSGETIKNPGGVGAKERERAWKKKMLGVQCGR